MEYYTSHQTPEDVYAATASSFSRLAGVASVFCLVTPVAFAGMDRAIYISPVPNSTLTAIVEVNQTRIRAGRHPG